MLSLQRAGECGGGAGATVLAEVPTGAAKAERGRGEAAGREDAVAGREGAVTSQGGAAVSAVSYAPLAFPSGVAFDRLPDDGFVVVAGDAEVGLGDRLFEGVLVATGRLRLLSGRFDGTIFAIGPVTVAGRVEISGTLYAPGGVSLAGGGRLLLDGRLWTDGGIELRRDC